MTIPDRERKAGLLARPRPQRLPDPKISGFVLRPTAELTAAGTAAESHGIPS